MKSPRFSQPRSKLKSPFLIRRVCGTSMAPSLLPGQIIIGWAHPRLQINDLIIFKHAGLEKIKRIQKINGERLYVVGDYAERSIDSRHFGWVPRSSVLAKIIRAPVLKSPE